MQDNGNIVSKQAGCLRPLNLTLYTSLGRNERSGHPISQNGTLCGPFLGIRLFLGIAWRLDHCVTESWQERGEGATS